MCDFVCIEMEVDTPTVFRIAQANIFNTFVENTYSCSFKYFNESPIRRDGQKA